MFTGIVEERARVRSALEHRLAVECRTVSAGARIGDSIAVNGVCLTVVERSADHLGFDLSEETLARTSLGRLSEGDAVNLERPLTLSSGLGGHLVQGHVDGLGRVRSLARDETGATLVVETPANLRRYLVEKGSVCVDGVSLTVASADGESFAVALIPHTLEVTTLGSARVGDPVNLEADVIAKYVERLLVEGRHT